MVIKFYFITLFIYSICIVNIFSLTELESFYVKNLDDFGKFDGVKLDSDEKGLILRSTTAIEENKSFLLLNRDWMISSAAFYPFKDRIKKGLNNIDLEPDSKIEIDENTTKYLLISVFQLMYHRLGDSEKARLLYSQKDNNLIESEFYCFELTEKRKHFLKIIFNFNLPGMYKFDIQNQQLADTLRISIDFLKVMDYFRKNLINYLQTISNLPIEEKEFILSFISDHEVFYRAIYLINNFSVSAPKDYFFSFNNESLEEEKRFRIKYNFTNNYDFVIYPMFNLFKNQYSSTTNSQDEKLIKINNYQDYIIASLGYSVLSGSPLLISRFNHVNHEQFYVFTGTMAETETANYDVIHFTFDKTKLTEPKSSLCIEYGCSNFDMESFLSSNITQKNMTYILQKGEYISYNLWNNFRLLAMKDSLLRNRKFLSNLFIGTLPVEFETDLKGYIGYYNLLKNKDNETLSYGNLMYDYHKIKRYQSSFRNFNNKVTKSMSESTSFEVKKNLYFMAIDKKRIIYNHFNCLLDKTRDLLRSDILKIKKLYIIKD